MVLSIREYDSVKCINFTQVHHYSKVMPRLTKHYLGLFNDDELVGVVTLGWGTQPLATINKLFPGYTTKDYYELGKLCVHDKMPRNTESQYISLLVKWMKENTDRKLLYTLADGIVGKIGYVYQASNFYYGGFFWTDVYIGADGEKIHPRTARQLCKENAEFVGKEKIFWLTPEFIQMKGIRRIRGKMYRYVYPLSKKVRKEVETKGWNIDFPKDDSLVWREQVSRGKYIVLPEIPQFALGVVNVNANNVNRHRKG